MRKLVAASLILAGALIGCQSNKSSAEKATAMDACTHCPGVQKVDGDGACEMCKGKNIAGKCTVCDAPKS